MHRFGSIDLQIVTCAFHADPMEFFLIFGRKQPLMPLLQFSFEEGKAMADTKLSENSKTVGCASDNVVILMSAIICRFRFCTEIALTCYIFQHLTNVLDCEQCHLLKEQL